MNIKPLVVTIAAVSGGGKTAITSYLNKLLPDSKALYFDDFEFKGPEDICKWVDEGANYNEWELSPLINEIDTLLSDSSHTTDIIFIDYPFAYKNDSMRRYIDYAVFIDTPLDVAMARRILRDFKGAHIDEVKAEAELYLSRSRFAYLEAINTIKPNSDLVVDGTLSINDIAAEILKRIKVL